VASNITTKPKQGRRAMHLSNLSSIPLSLCESPKQAQACTWAGIFAQMQMSLKSQGETIKNYFIHFKTKLAMYPCDIFNGTAHFKNVNNCLNTNIYSCLETYGGQSSNLYLNVVHYFNTSFISNNCGSLSLLFSCIDV
jgi:hypothetical protein